MIETSPRPVTAATTGGAGGPRQAWRLSPRMRKLVLAAHVLVAVGWFGVVLAKLVLEVSAVTTQEPAVARAAYGMMASLDRVTFPPMAVATLVTGVILSLGTAWGLFRHYWIVVKLVLTVAVVVTGIVFVGAWTRQAIEMTSGGLVPYQQADSLARAPVQLIGAAMVHLLMLGAAAVISVFKPWGLIRPDRHVLARRGARPSPSEPR